jgi:hypothetical protein
MFFMARQAAATLAARAGRTSTTSTEAGSMAMEGSLASARFGSC